MDNQICVYFYKIAKRDYEMENVNYEKMKQVDVRTVDANTIVDIDEIEINPSLSKEERMSCFVENIGNPFCYKCNEMVVKAVYSDEGSKLEDKMIHLFMTMSGIMN